MASSNEMSNIAVIICLCLLFCGQNKADDNIDLSNVVIIVITQPNEYHAEQAHEFVKHIQHQIPNRQPGTAPVVELTHEAWPGVAAWAISPILNGIWKRYSGWDWVLFCTEGTLVRLDALRLALNEYDPKEPLLVGRELRDAEATIIHHFAFHHNPSSFAYPDLATGFVMSMSLVSELVDRLSTSKLKSDFSIDPIHELAMYIHDNGNGYEMTSDAAFCVGDEHAQCATSFPQHAPQCGEAVSEDSMFIAVKTCTQFHQDRVPVVQQTWGKDARHLVFYSDTADPAIPTESTGVPNTERGHCGKTMVILRRFHSSSNLSKFQWLVIADDDTLLSVGRLRALLACYDPAKPLVLGERYGYSVTSEYGYDYITGGGSIVLSRTAVRQLLEGACECGADDSPDDMTLGLCFKRLHIPVTHSPLFHQARPMDYAAGLLQHQRPVSFHKHWMLEPVSVYKQWFGTEQPPAEQPPAEHQRQEL